MQITVLAVGLVIASSAFGQAQSTTDTNCNVNGQQVNCTSRTTAPPPDPWANFNKTLTDNRARAEANRNRQAQAQAQANTSAEAKQEVENHAKVNIAYCRENPAGSVTSEDGQAKPCADELAYEKAFCSVKPDADRCQLLVSRAELEKQFADLAEKYKYDPRANKKDCKAYYDSLFAKLRSAACVSYPDMQTPLRDGTLQPCK
jgi:hypothetical protein